jgi:pyruvate formate lyase activating enzyme
MIISGIQKFSVIDYPEKTSCIVFTPGCNFRCGFCHNPEFVLPEEIATIKHSFFDDVPFFNFLKTRKGKLDGVVITGGEPTLQTDLLDFMKKIKDLGFFVKLDSNGNKTDILIKAIEKGLVDYIAMDVKTSIQEYKHVVGGMVNIDNIQKSIDIIMNSGIDYEFRTTVLPDLHTKEILKDMKQLISGAKKLYIQNFLSDITLDCSFASKSSFNYNELQDIAESFRDVVDIVEVRS